MLLIIRLNMFFVLQLVVKIGINLA